MTAQAIACILGITTGILGTALWLHTDRAAERRAAAVRAERAARPAGRISYTDLVTALLNSACCEHWWTSRGTQHDPDCTNAPNAPMEHP
ncbi:hypothetical protein ACWEFL_15860 [Streptomyces sp. NPDC004838]